MDTTGVTHLTFDCYGTIIDWETGILSVLRELAAAAPSPLDDAGLLESYARHEAEVEAGPWRRYREVLDAVEERVAADLGVALDDDVRGALSASVVDWPPFPDSVAALRRLSGRFALVILSNVDDDLFEGTRARLDGVELADVVTAEKTRTYKPDPRHFRLAMERLGIGPSGSIHVAQSVYHDHVPAARLGIRSIRVNRRSVLTGRGITPPDPRRPPVEVRDLRAVADLLL